MAEYARLLHDYQWMSYKSRTVSPGWAGLPSTPETVPFYVNSTAGSADKDDVILSTAWDKYLQQLNGERGYKFIISPPAGWFNRNKAADSLGFGGNVVEVISTDKKSAKIKAFHFKDNPPSASSWNFDSHPELVHKFTVITSTGQVVNPATDIDVYTFVIGRNNLFVPLTRIEMFPKLPQTVKVSLTKAFGLEIKSAPSDGAKTIGKFGTLKSITLTNYAPKGQEVWGETDEGWVKLYYYERNTKVNYTTSWSMKTLPPVPPVN
jgi:hypothetical protein